MGGISIKERSFGSAKWMLQTQQIPPNNRLQANNSSDHVTRLA